MRILRVISLFSGCGGLDLGLIQSGMKIVWANDIFKPAIKNYRYNIGKITDQDIRKVNPKDVPNADLIVGGFPCQPFSTAGKRLGVNDNHDRGNLYLEIIRMVRVKNPKVVICENVRGILSMKNKDGSRLINTVVYLLEHSGKHGYSVKYKLLRASDYEVPQNRYRVFIIAFRKDLHINYQFPDPTTTINDNLSIGHTISHIPDSVPNKYDVWKLSPQSRKLIRFIPEGGSWKNIPYRYLPKRWKKIRNHMKRYHSPNFYRRFSRKEIAGTITASATPDRSGILHPTQNRRFSVREIARIQTFPDSYKFIGSTPNMYKMIGNAVPPHLAKVIGSSIIKALDGKQHTNQQLTLFN